MDFTEPLQFRVYVSKMLKMYPIKWKNENVFIYYELVQRTNVRTVLIYTQLQLQSTDINLIITKISNIKKKNHRNISYPNKNIFVWYWKSLNDNNIFHIDTFFNNIHILGIIH